MKAPVFKIKRGVKEQRKEGTGMVDKQDKGFLVLGQSVDSNSDIKKGRNLSTNNLGKVPYREEEYG